MFQKGKNHKHTEETKKKISEARKGMKKIKCPLCHKGTYLMPLNKAEKLNEREMRIKKMRKMGWTYYQIRKVEKISISTVHWYLHKRKRSKY